MWVEWARVATSKWVYVIEHWHFEAHLKPNEPKSQKPYKKIHIKLCFVWERKWGRTQMAMDGSSNNNPEEFPVGCLLSIKTTLGDEFDAQLITFDRHSNILVLHILSSTYFFLSNPIEKRKAKKN